MTPEVRGNARRRRSSRSPAAFVLRWPRRLGHGLRASASVPLSGVASTGPETGARPAGTGPWPAVVPRATAAPCPPACTPWSYPAAGGSPNPGRSRHEGCPGQRTASFHASPSPEPASRRAVRPAPSRCQRRSSVGARRPAGRRHRTGRPVVDRPRDRLGRRRHDVDHRLNRRGHGARHRRGRRRNGASHRRGRLSHGARHRRGRLATVRVTGAVASATVRVTGAVASATVRVTGAVAAATVRVTGAVASATVRVTGALASATVRATGSVASATVRAAGSLAAATVASDRLGRLGHGPRRRLTRRGDRRLSHGSRHSASPRTRFASPAPSPRRPPSAPAGRLGHGPRRRLLAAATVRAPARSPRPRAPAVGATVVAASSPRTVRAAGSLAAVAVRATGSVASATVRVAGSVASATAFVAGSVA